MIFGNLVKEVTFNKGFYDFVDAGVILDKDRCKFWIIGDSPQLGFFEQVKKRIYKIFSKEYLSEKEVLIQRVKSLGKQSLFRFLGKQADIYSFINAADFIIIPHRVPEPFGRTLIEAGLFKKPVITSNLKPTDEIVTNNQTGLLITPGNTNEIVDAMEFLISNKEKAKQFGDKFFQDIKMRFNLRINNRMILSMYDSLLNR
jgi:glycosyltransferase involved in cell wall biosynthesis